MKDKTGSKLRLQVEKEKNQKEVNVFAERIELMEKALDAH